MSGSLGAQGGGQGAPRRLGSSSHWDFPPRPEARDNSPLPHCLQFHPGRKSFLAKLRVVAVDGEMGRFPYKWGTLQKPVA